MDGQLMIGVLEREPTAMSQQFYFKTTFDKPLDKWDVSTVEHATHVLSSIPLQWNGWILGAHVSEGVSKSGALHGAAD
jgi:hypothetical protein